MSFVMSLFARQVPGLASVIANSVALTPNPPRWSVIKGQIFPFVLERLLSVPYVSPNWSDYTAFSFGRVMGRTVSMFHRECDVPACHMLRLLWDTVWPALYEHTNLAAGTHPPVGATSRGTNPHYPHPLPRRHNTDT